MREADNRLTGKRESATVFPGIENQLKGRFSLSHPRKQPGAGQMCRVIFNLNEFVYADL